MDKANEIASTNPEKYYMPQQFVNPANPEAHYRKTAVELSEQLGKKIDIYVSGVGSGGTLQGIAKYLLEQNPDTKIVAVEPKEFRHFTEMDRESTRYKELEMDLFRMY